MQGPIQSVEVSYLVHSTEDEERIDVAVTAHLGLLGEATREEMDGHFGNKIVRISRHMTGEDAARAFATIVSKMSPALKGALRDEVAKHLDEHSTFYARLDKQALMAGRLELTDSDPVRIRVKPKMHMVKGGAASFFGRALT